MTFTLLIAGIILLVVLKLLPDKMVPWARDPGPPPGQRYPFWDKWSWWHLIGSAVLSIVFLFASKDAASALMLPFILEVGWEFVEGYVSESDLVVDLLGNIGGTLIGVIIWHAIGFGR